MDIDRCNSIFELFTAFNFTYAVFSKTNGSINKVENGLDGSSFVDLIDNKILRPITEFFEQIIPLEEDATVMKKSCDKRIELEKLKANPNQVVLSKWQSLSTKLDIITDQIKTWREDAEKNKIEAKSKINNRFPYISFLSALFCLTVLGIAASEADYKHFTLLILDIIVIFLIIKGVNKETYFTYPQIIKSFTWALVILIITHFGIKIGYEYCNEFICKCLTFLDIDSIWKSLFILFNILLPFWHFPYYYRDLSKLLNTMKVERQSSLTLITTTLTPLTTEYTHLTEQHP
jgi:hypothetical protein